MAHLIQVNDPRSKSEADALAHLATALPESWLITTNVKEHNFAGLRRRAPEIDSILFTPQGILVLDFKNFHGTITPMRNRTWGGLDNETKNPFEQATNNIYIVKDLFRHHDKRLRDIKLEYLIILTAQDSELDWQGSDAELELQRRVTLLRDVEDKARTIIDANRGFLTPAVVLTALEALRPVNIPEGLFEEGYWDGWTKPDEAAVRADVKLTRLANRLTVLAQRAHALSEADPFAGRADMRDFQTMWRLIEQVHASHSREVGKAAKVYLNDFVAATDADIAALPDFLAERGLTNATYVHTCFGNAPVRSPVVVNMRPRRRSQVVPEPDVKLPPWTIYEADAIYTHVTGNASYPASVDACCEVLSAKGSALHDQMLTFLDTIEPDTQLRALYEYLERLDGLRPAGLVALTTPRSSSEAPHWPLHTALCRIFEYRRRINEMAEILEYGIAILAMYSE